MVAFSITPIRQRVNEGGSITFRINISNPNYDAVGSYKIYWRTNATASNAASSSDYESKSSLQEIRFSASSPQSVNISLSTFADTRVEGDEFFEVDLYDNLGKYLSGSATTFTILDVAPARPDLVINSLSPSTTRVAAGGQLTAQVGIGNGGDAASGTFSTRFYLSKTSTIDPSTATVLATSSGNSVASQSSTGWSQLLNIPAGLTPGTYYLGVWADYNDAVSESNNSNNSYATAITITGPARPDLTINTLSPSTTKVATGGQLTAQVGIGNEGDAASGTFSTRFYLSKTSTIDPSTATPLATSSGNSVASHSSTGWSQLLNIPAGLTPGTYYLGVWADYNDAVSESNNSNNSYATAITITGPARPDLKINGLSPSTSSVAIGGQMTAQVVVGNDGDAPSGAFATRFYLSKTSTIDPSTATVLATSSGNFVANQSSTGWSQLLTIPAVIAPGTYYLGVWADYNDLVVENDNTNNIASMQIRVGVSGTDKQVIPLPYDDSATPTVSGAFGHDKAPFLYHAVDFAGFGDQLALSVGTGRVIATQGQITTNGYVWPDTSGIGNFVTIYFIDPRYPDYRPAFMANGLPPPNSLSDADTKAEHGYYASYFHLKVNSLAVSAGRDVKLGDVIGAPGDTGYSGGEHLHFQVGATLKYFTSGWIADAGSSASDPIPVQFLTADHGIIDMPVELQTYRSTNNIVMPVSTGPAVSPKTDLAIANITREGPGAFQNALLRAQLENAHLPSNQEIAAIASAAMGTTSVATLAYQFFTGRVPSANGMDYLVSSTGPNSNNLNSQYYQHFNLENRYINFAVNLGKGKDAFSAQFGSKSLAEVASAAYATIFGATPSSAKVSALISGRTDYFAAYGGDGPNGIGTKSAMVGWLLAEAVKADIGMYANSNRAFLIDLADGAEFGVNLIGAYGKPEFIFGGT